MLFSSIPFLYYFFPAVILLYFIAPKRLKNTVLLITSLVFYGYGEPIYLLLMIASILLGYVYGLLIGRFKGSWKAKAFVALSCVTSLGFLAYFKYADFFISSFNAAFGLSIPLLKIALPIGISFYSFQILSYTIDVYRGTVPACKNFINFGAFVSFFPQLIAGPIVRYSDIIVELQERSVSAEKIYRGIRRFLAGLAKKILIANTMGELCSLFRESGEKSVLFYWMYAIAFTLQIYFDFSGYSDMAIGMGHMFGFNFPENFNFPYIAKSITEFWRRWHMTLSSWFRDYVYIPLGGNRVPKWRWLFNIVVVWALTGLWHGAAGNFILWGLLYAVLLIIEKVWLLDKLNKIPAFLSHLYVLLFVTLGFVLFNADSISGAVADLGGLFGFADSRALRAETLYYLRSYAILLVIAIIGSTPLPRKLLEKLRSLKKGKSVLRFAEPAAMIVLLLVCTAFLVDGSFNPFLYFRF